MSFDFPFSITGNECVNAIVAFISDMGGDIFIVNVHLVNLEIF
jgi:hypothetical protein